MTTTFEDGPVTVHQGDVLDALARMPDESVQCVLTSPPYWGLRDYGVEGQLGLEDTPEEFVSNMVGVFREVGRVLRKDGTLWLNMGDSYASHDPGGYREGEFLNPGGRPAAKGSARNRAGVYRPSGLKPKDLIGMPWMLAFALRADGWFLRSDIIWSKPNPMPESVTDRPTKAHEYLFLLTKNARYFYDADAIRTPSAATSTKMPDGWDMGDGGSYHRNGREKGVDKQRGHGRRHAGFNERWDAMDREQQQANGANARDVWTIATQAYPEAHFATYPEKLVEPCIKAGTKEGDVVLDPFAGSGTTLAVARRLGRRAVGIELNPDYVELIRRRVAGAALPLLEAIEVPA